MIVSSARKLRAEKEDQAFEYLSHLFEAKLAELTAAIERKEKDK